MDLERQGFSDVASNASNAVYELNSDVKRLKRLCNRTTASSGLSEVVAKVATKCKQASQVISSLNTFGSNELGATERQQQTQITGEFNHLVKEIATLQQKAGLLLKEQVAAQQAQQHDQHDVATADANTDNASESTPLIQVLEQLDQGTVDLHQQLLEERELEIVEIQRGMNEINAIFSDLGTLIQEQGQQLDTVEDHVTDVYTQTHSASAELIRADNYQKSRGKWSCYCLLALLVITVLVALTLIN